MKAKKVSCTYLTHNTKEVLSMVRELGAIYIENYNSPIAVLVDLKTWEKLSQDSTTRKMSLDEIKNIAVKSKAIRNFNSTNIIRKLRDEE